MCPLHRWTYDLQGKLLGAPHFADQPCAHLGRTPLQNWNGLLFDGPRDVARDSRGLTLAATSTSPATCSTASSCTSATTTGRPSSRSTSRTTTSQPFHPGLGQFVTCDDLRWEFGDWRRCRRSASTTASRKPGTPTYERWHKAVLDTTAASRRTHGAIWLTYYPNIMVEWYPHVLVVCTLIPPAPQKTLNVVEFYYPEEIALFEREFVEAEQAAYMETAQRGRRDRRAHGRRPQARCIAQAAARSARTRRRWKTACSTSTSSTGARWNRISRHC